MAVDSPVVPDPPETAPGGVAGVTMTTAGTAHVLGAGAIRTGAAPAPTVPAVVAQYAILAALLLAWLYTLYMYLAQHTAAAEAFAFGGWGAVLAAWKADFGGGA